MSKKKLKKRIAVLEAENAELKQEVADLEEEVDYYEKGLDKLAAMGKKMLEPYTEEDDV